MLRKASITGRARVIPEAVVVVNEDVRAFSTDWNNADPLTGLEVDSFGDVRLSGSFATSVEHTVSDTFMTDLDRASPWSVAKVTWGGTFDRDLEIWQIKAWLHPKRTGAAKEVVTWRLEVWRIYAVWPASHQSPGPFEIQGLGSMDVAASGTVAALFTFDFTGAWQAPRPMFENVIRKPGASAQALPVTYIVIRALDANGAAAGNVGFGADTATPFVNPAGVKLEQVTLTQNTEGEGRGRWAETLVNDCPRISIVEETYTNATITISVAGGGTIIDLGAAPTKDVECVGVGRTPSDTDIVYEIRKASPDAWTEFEDGDLICVDNTATGGKDLSSLAKQQTYEIRAQLKTNAASNTTPRLKRLGVREVTRISFDRLATVDAEWNVHPFEMQSEISRAAITSIRDGREDFNDAITELLVDHDVADIAFRIYIGHPDLHRNKWLHVDTFPFAYDYDPRANEIECLWDSALTKLRAALPVASGSPTVTHSILNYNAAVGIETLKDVSDDLIDGQVALAGRYRSQGITDATTTISKRIGERDPDAVVTALSDAKTELDAVAFIAGGAWGTDAGRVRFFDLYAEGYVVMLFHEGEITVESVSPGLSLRTPEVFLAYAYDVQSREYTLEHRGFDGTALAALGVSNLGPPKRLSDTVGKWVDDATLAAKIVERQFNAFSMGLRLWRFTCTYAYPELQFGDRVIIPTKQFVMRDPIGNRELRGHLWAIGTIIGVHDVLGTSFTIWVRSLSDILASSEAVVIELRKGPIVRLYHGSNVTYSSPVSEQFLAWDQEVLDDEGFHDTVTNNSRITIGFTGKYLIQGVIRYSALATVGIANGWFRVRKSPGPSYLGAIGLLSNLTNDAEGDLPFAMVADLVKDDWLEISYLFTQVSAGTLSVQVDGGAVTDSTFDAIYVGR